MTDDELIGELQRALNEAQAEERSASVRVGRLSTAIACLTPQAEEVPPATAALHDDLTPAKRAERKAALDVARKQERQAKRSTSHAKKPCPDCGVPVAPQGLPGHRRKHHAAPPAPLQSVPDERPPLSQFSSTPQVPGHHFECDSCDKSYPTTRELTAHTIDVHGRRTNATERIPRAS